MKKLLTLTALVLLTACAQVEQPELVTLDSTVVDTVFVQDTVAVAVDSCLVDSLPCKH